MRALRWSSCRAGARRETGRTEWEAECNRCKNSYERSCWSLMDLTLASEPSRAGCLLS